MDILDQASLGNTELVQGTLLSLAVVSEDNGDLKSLGNIAVELWGEEQLVVDTMGILVRQLRIGGQENQDNSLVEVAAPLFDIVDPESQGNSSASWELLVSAHLPRRPAHHKRLRIAEIR